MVAALRDLGLQLHARRRDGARMQFGEAEAAPLIEAQRVDVVVTPASVPASSTSNAGGRARARAVPSGPRPPSAAVAGTQRRPARRSGASRARASPRSIQAAARQHSDWSSWTVSVAGLLTPELLPARSTATTVQVFVPSNVYWKADHATPGARHRRGGPVPIDLVLDRRLRIDVVGRRVPRHHVGAADVVGRRGRGQVRRRAGRRPVAARLEGDRDGVAGGRQVARRVARADGERVRRPGCQVAQPERKIAGGRDDLAVHQHVIAEGPAIGRRSHASDTLDGVVAVTASWRASSAVSRPARCCR